MIDFQVAYDKLASLDCANDIALFLQEQGVLAVKLEPKQCAIAKWISDSTELDEIYVDGISIDRWGAKGYKTLAECTESMRNFIVAFDHGKYPFLEKDDDDD